MLKSHLILILLQINNYIRKLKGISQKHFLIWQKNYEMQKHFYVKIKLFNLYGAKVRQKPKRSETDLKICILIYEVQ